MISLSQEDVQFMLSVLQLTTELKESLAARGAGDVVVIQDDVADELRDLCTERLDTHGFDQNYELNDEGEILESLVDKLYVG